MLYDKNNITIEGDINVTFSEDWGARHACGWQVINVEDGNDVDAVAAAIEQAKAETENPPSSSAALRYRLPAKQGKASAHGEPLARRIWPRPRKPWAGITLPLRYRRMCTTAWRKTPPAAPQAQKDWEAMMQKYAAEYPAEYAEYQQWMNREFPLI